MKKELYFVLLVATIVTIISCDENVSTKGELTDKYSVILILRGDTTTQSAYLSRTYDVQGFDPYTSETDPAVNGATIALNYAGDEQKKYFFRDTIDNNHPNPRYSTPSKYYYLKNFQPRYDSDIELTVTLPDGKKLTSSTHVPQKILFDNTRSSQVIFTPPKNVVNFDTVNINVYWTGVSVNLLKAKTVSFVYYHKNGNGTKTRYIKEVPISVSAEPGDTVVDYHNLSFRNEIHIPRKLIAKALWEISEGDPKKDKYSVAPLKVSILLFDDGLTRNYRSKLYFDYGFTIRNYPGDVTNINSGLGFFGSYSNVKKLVLFDQRYLSDNFGYLADSSFMNNPY